MGGPSGDKLSRVHQTCRSDEAELSGLSRISLLSSSATSEERNTLKLEKGKLAVYFRIAYHVRILQFLEQDAVDRSQLERILNTHGLAAKWEKFKTRFLSE